MTTPFIVSAWPTIVDLSWILLALSVILWLVKRYRIVKAGDVWPWLETAITESARAGGAIIAVDVALTLDAWIIANAVQYSAYSGFFAYLTFTAAGLWLVSLFFFRGVSITRELFEGNRAIGLLFIALALFAAAAKLGT